MFGNFRARHSSEFPEGICEELVLFLLKGSNQMFHNFSHIIDQKKWPEVLFMDLSSISQTVINPCKTTTVSSVLGCLNSAQSHERESNVSIWCNDSH